MRLLITGFEPFSRDGSALPAINASSEAVRRLRSDEISRRAGVRVEVTRCTDVPVRWTVGPREILAQAGDADIVIPVGEVGSGEAPAHLRLEQAARNLGADGALFPGEPAQLLSTVSAAHRAEIAARLLAEGIEAGPATDESCGNYLCNATYYELLRAPAERWVQFVHVRAFRDDEGLALLARGLEIVAATLVALR